MLEAVGKVMPQTVISVPMPVGVRGPCPGVGEPLYGEAILDMPVLESLPSYRGVMHSSSEPFGTHSYSHSSLGQGYSRDQPEN